MWAELEVWRGEICRDKLIAESPHRAPRYIHKYVMPRATRVRDHGLLMDLMEQLMGSCWESVAEECDGPTIPVLNQARHRPESTLCRKSAVYVHRRTHMPRAI